MSGPKDYIAEPEYTKDALSGELAQLLQQQSKLLLLMRQINDIDVRDGKLGLHLSGSQSTIGYSERWRQLCDPLIFELEGTFGQVLYNQAKDIIEQHLQKVNIATQEAMQILNTLECKVDDYKSYTSYKLAIESSQKALNEYKTLLADKFKTPLLCQYAPDLVEEAQSSIMNTSVSFSVQPFSDGFRNQKGAANVERMQKVKAIEDDLERKRAVFNQKTLVILSKLPAHITEIQHVNQVKLSNEDLSVLQEKINKQISTCFNPNLRAKWLNEFTILKDSKALQNKHFYAQLHDKMLEEIKIAAIKEQALEILRVVSKLKVDTRFISEKQIIMNQCNAILEDKARVSSDSVISLKVSTENLREKVKQWKQKDRVRKNELLFLKAQVISAMEKKGYEVLDDLELIDFEKAESFYLKTKDDNIVNLKFDEDGHLRYFFQIPEEHRLSTDEEGVKLASMQVSCDDFKNVMLQLKSLGLKIDVKDEKPVSRHYISKTTPDKRMKVKDKSRSGIQAVKRRYLKD